MRPSSGWWQPRGLDKLDALARIATDATLPALARELFAVLARNTRALAQVGTSKPS